MLADMIDKDLIDCRAIVGFYPCNSNKEDDIEVYDENDSSTLKAKLHTLRQQMDKD